jgi:hypothetical protein
MKETRLLLIWRAQQQEAARLKASAQKYWMLSNDNLGQVRKLYSRCRPGTNTADKDSSGQKDTAIHEEKDQEKDQEPGTMEDIITRVDSWLEM